MVANFGLWKADVFGKGETRKTFFRLEKKCIFRTTTGGLIRREDRVFFMS